MNSIAIPSETKRIAILLPSWVGDCIMATPLLRVLRERRPEAYLIGILRPGLDQILDGSPWLDECITGEIKGFRGPLRAAQAIKRLAPDALLLLPNNFRSGLIARLSGVPIRIGYRREMRDQLLTHALKVERTQTPTPTIDYYNRLGEYALGGDPIERAMQLFTTQQEERDAERLLEGIDGRFVLLNPGGNRPDKRWPAHRFAEVAQALNESSGLMTVISGAPQERELTSKIRQSMPDPSKIVDLAQRGITLGTLKAIIKKATLMITNDTGPRHMGAALGTPLVTLFGPTDHRWTTLECSHERILLAEPFLPEEQIADRHSKDCRIDRICTSDVFNASQSLLAMNR